MNVIITRSLNYLTKIKHATKFTTTISLCSKHRQLRLQVSNRPSTRRVHGATRNHSLPARDLSDTAKIQ